MLELMVVMAVAVLLLTAVPTLISAAMPGLELKAAARRTVASLRLARETAIRTGADAALTVDVEERRLTLPGFRPISLPKRLYLSVEAASGEMQDETKGAIRFFPDGSSSGGVIYLTRGEESERQGYEVGVTWLTGRVRMAPLEPR